MRNGPHFSKNFPFFTVLDYTYNSMHVSLFFLSLLYWKPTNSSQPGIQSAFIDCLQATCKNLGERPDLGKNVIKRCLKGDIWGIYLFPDEGGGLWEIVWGVSMEILREFKASEFKETHKTGSLKKGSFCLLLIMKISGGGAEEEEEEPISFPLLLFFPPLYFSTDIEMIEIPAGLIIRILLTPREGLRS